MISDQSDKKNIQGLISCCSLFVSGENLLIVCPNNEIFLSLVHNYKFIPIQVVCEATITCITIATGERRVSFPVNPGYKLHLPNMDIHPQGLDLEYICSRIASEKDEDIISDVLGFEGSASIVRFGDDSGLFSNSRVFLSSATSPNDWVGQKMSTYWIDEELEKYKQALLADTQVSNFSYVAYLFTGQAARFLVNARLTLYRGDLVRVVKCLMCEPLI